MWCDIFINDLDDGTERTLSKSVGDAEQGRIFDRPDGCAASWRDQPRWKRVMGLVPLCVFRSSVERGVDGEVVKFIADTGVVNWP